MPGPQELLTGQSTPPVDVYAAAKKAETIGPSRVGERYQETEAPWTLGDLARRVLGFGPERPSSVAAQDPYGLGAMEIGAGDVPVMVGSTSPRLPRALGSLAATLKTTPEEAVYALRAPVTSRLRRLYDIGRTLPTRANWSGSMHDELLHAFGGDEAAAQRWARLWAATSPNTSVPVNTRESVSALAHGLEHPGVPLTTESARRLPGAKITMAGSKVPNINLAYEGQPLGSDKVEAMSGFMLGQPRIPIDVHALYAVGSASDKLQPELPALRSLMTEAEGLPRRGGLTNTDLYTRYEQALHDTLTPFARRQPINQIFADLWEGARAHKGLAPQGGPIDILRRQGLLEAGAMLDPERLRAVLTKSGWTAGAIGGLLAVLQHEQVATPPPAQQ